MSIIIKSGDSTNLAHVTPTNSLQVALESNPATAGSVMILDSQGNPILTTENGALDISLDSIVLYEQVDGSALNTNVWTTSTQAMTITQANGFITLNANATTTASSYAIWQSIRSIPLYGHLPLKTTINARVATLPLVNMTMEIGLGIVSGTSAPTDGAFFRWSVNGDFRCVMNNAGSEIVSGPLTPPDINDVHLFDIIMVEDLVQYYLDDVLVATLLVPPLQAYPTNSGRQQVFARVYTSAGLPATAPVLSIGQVLVTQQATNQTKDWAELMSQLGRAAYQSPTAYTQTTNHANSTSPSSATLSNTAAGYTTLGGRYQFVAPAGAATDYALFAYQIPANYQLIIRAISISAMNTGATVLVTPTILDWSVGLNSSAVSLATADSPPTSWAPRHIPMGMSGFAVGALQGVSSQDIRMVFPVPLVVDGGRFLHIIVQVPVGTATASQVIRGDVMIDGYFE